MIRSLITEYGLYWVTNRLLYSAKLKMMKAIPLCEKFFEKKVCVKKVDIFELNNDKIEKFLINLSYEKKMEIISIADNAIEGKILGFSSIELDYGNPINWHYNPITKAEIERSIKWYQIPDFDSRRGDIKIVWEASRFTHFIYFSRAYMIKKDTRYYDAFSNQLDEWLKANPYSYGANFKCGQEATLRIINALMAYSIFKSYGLITQRDEDNLKKLVEVNYKKILSNFFYAQKCIKNNHTLSEITGLIIGAWCCADWKNLQKAYKLLDNEIQNQFFPDGGYIQYSFNYQRFALQLMECVLKISGKTSINISKKSKSLIRKSAFLLYQMQDESGDVPNYGSNDGALIFPVTACGYRDFRPVINTIYALINGKRLYESGDYDEELLWFGDKSLDRISVQKIKKESSSFNEAGFYSIRHSNGFLMTVLQDFKTRPAQMDQLHLDIWYNGKNIFCDSGTYSYATDTGKKMALTSAHNTVQIDEKEQMNKRDPFMIYNWSKSDKIKNDNGNFVGTMVSKSGYEHTRAINKTKFGYEILDEVKGDGKSCKFLFHTPCDIKIGPEGFQLLYEGKKICDITTKGLVEIKRVYRSLYYMKKDTINCISVRCNITNKICNMKFDLEFT